MSSNHYLVVVCCAFGFLKIHAPPTLLPRSSDAVRRCYCLSSHYFIVSFSESLRSFSLFLAIEFIHDFCGQRKANASHFVFDCTSICSHGRTRKCAKRAASTHIPITLAPKRAEPVPSPTGVPTPAPTPDSTPAPPPAPTPVCIDLAPESNGTKRQRSVSPEIDGETGTNDKEDAKKPKLTDSAERKSKALNSEDSWSLFVKTPGSTCNPGALWKVHIARAIVVIMETAKKIFAQPANISNDVPVDGFPPTRVQLFAGRYVGLLRALDQVQKLVLFRDSRGRHLFNVTDQLAAVGCFSPVDCADATAISLSDKIQKMVTNDFQFWLFMNLRIFQGSIAVLDRVAESEIFPRFLPSTSEYAVRLLAEMMSVMSFLFLCH